MQGKIVLSGQAGRLTCPMEEIVRSDVDARVADGKMGMHEQPDGV